MDFSIYLNEIEWVEKLTKDEELSLIKRIKNKDKFAYEQLILSLQPLVINIAKKYSSWNMDIMDIIENWNLWLIKAIEKYDITKNVKFSTYASYRIKYYIIRWINDNLKNIYIPSSIFNKIWKYNQIYQKLLQKFEKEPSLVSISKEMWIELSEAKKIKQIIEWEQSLNTKIQEDNTTEIGDNLIDVNTPTLDIIVEQNYLKKRIKKYFNKLSKKESDFIKSFYWIWTEKKKLWELAKEYNISVSRAKQIIQKILNKIKDNVKIM